MKKQAIYLIAIALGILVGTLTLLARCTTPPAPQTIEPPAWMKSSATSSAAVTGSQAVRMMVRRSGERSLSPLSTTPEEITIELSQAFIAQASAGAVVFHDRSSVRDNDQACLGFSLTTLPGALALDYQLARVNMPQGLLGMPIEVGADVVGNLEAGGLGISAGGKSYALFGAWSSWNALERGVMVGAGLRF